MSSRNTRRILVGVLSTLVSMGAMGMSACSGRGGIVQASTDVPMATIERTDFHVEVNTTGDVRATQTALITAPPIAGGTLQIVHLLKTGTAVKAGDVVVEFDPSTEEYNLTQSKSDLDQAEEAIVKAKDDAAVQEAQDKTALLTANYAVRQAELDVSKAEIVSAIDAKKNQLTLDEAKRALAQLQQDIQSHALSNQAAIAVNEEKANKAKLAMNQAQTNIENMRVKTAIAGFVVVGENENASGGFFFTGMTLPDFQEGDQTYPGGLVARVIDISQMEIGAKVGEKDRGNVKVGQPVEIQVDALPGKVYQGTVKTVAGMGGGGFFGSDAAHQFDVTIAIDHPDNLLRPDFAAHVVIQGDDLKKVLCIPRQALFEKDGKPNVFVRTGNTFEEREIKLQTVTEGTAVIEGLKEGTAVALIDPTKNPAGPTTPAGGAGPSLGGAR